MKDACDAAAPGLDDEDRQGSELPDLTSLIDGIALLSRFESELADVEQTLAKSEAGTG